MGSWLVVLLLGAGLEARAITHAKALKPSKNREVIRWVHPKGGGCSATVVGPRTILTAAHCLKSERLEFRAEVAGKSYRFTGVRSPYYIGLLPEPHDMALAIASKVFKSKKLVPASLGGSPPYSELVRMLGWGCPYQNADADPWIREGRNLATAPTSELQFQLGEENREHTKETPASLLCAGDSGGPTYLDDPERPRVIVGVHSKTSHNGNYSKDTLIDSPTTRRFLEEFVEEFGAEICGYNLVCD